MKSVRNKTIDTKIEDAPALLERCIQISSKVALVDVLNKTINGDTLKVMPKLPDAFVDLAIVDPPYNLSKNYNGCKFKQSGDDEYEKYTQEWVKKLVPLLKEDASVYVCCDWRSSMVIGSVLKEHFLLQNRISWQREKGRGAAKNWKNGMEDIWFVTNSDKYIFNLDAVKVRKKVLAPYKVDGKPKDWEETKDGNFRNTCPSNFWDDISIPYWSMPENTAHPTQKPEKLIAKLILASSNIGDVVFDPFLGSGTTAVVAKKLGRGFVGIEQNSQYCLWAEQRLEQANSQPEIQGYSDGIFWDRNARVNKKHLPKSKR